MTYHRENTHYGRNGADRTACGEERRKVDDSTDEWDLVSCPACVAIGRDPVGARHATATYFIQDTRTFVGNCVYWWAKDGKGYTCHLDEAWEVDEEEARRIERMRDTDKAWPAAQVRAAASMQVDIQRLRSMALILPCGGCGTCEHCEALSWACNKAQNGSSDADVCRLLSLPWYANDTVKKVSWLRNVSWSAIRVPARAAELLRALLEARGVVVVRTHGEGPAGPGDSGGVAWCIQPRPPLESCEIGACLMPRIPSLILALLAIPPGEQREAALRAVKTAR